MSTVPPTTRPGTSTTLSIERARTDLPQPAAPTTHSVLPAWIPKLTPSTARTTPSSGKKCVRRSSTSSRYSPLRSGIRVPRISEAIAEEVECQDGDHDTDTREEEPWRL